jgi:hypothetical protein
MLLCAARRWKLCRRQNAKISCVRKVIFLHSSTLLLSLFLAASGVSQQIANQQDQKTTPPAAPVASPSPAQQPGQPPVRVNYLNVCAPGAEEQKEIKSAFARVAGKPAFSSDFEVSRGRATVEDSKDSRFVRLRKDTSVESPLLNAQYSMSTDDVTVIETLVVRTRDPKQFHELSLEDRLTSGTTAATNILTMDTPVTRIRLERFSKASIVLTRCPDQDQKAYEPLFRQATDIMSEYRKAMALRSVLGSDINWLNALSATPGTSSPATKKKQP